MEGWTRGHMLQQEWKYGDRHTRWLLIGSNAYVFPGMHKHTSQAFTGHKTSTRKVAKRGTFHTNAEVCNKLAYVPLPFCCSLDSQVRMS